MTEQTDIVERLRFGVNCPVSGIGGDLGGDMLEAAATIERLRAENETLQGLLRETLGMADNWPGIAYTDDLIARAKIALPTRR